jgi:hypothetical protein
MEKEWTEIAQRGEVLFQHILESGTTTPYLTDLDSFKSVILTFLDSFPITVSNLQIESHSWSSSATASFLANIERIRLQTELSLAICTEFSQPCTIGKIRNLSMTWKLR